MEDVEPVGTQLDHRSVLRDGSGRTIQQLFPLRRGLVDSHPHSGDLYCEEEKVNALLAS
jgi:hypothetical protein